MSVEFYHKVENYFSAIPYIVRALGGRTVLIFTNSNQINYFIKN